MCWLPLIELLFSLRRAMLRITPGVLLCSKPTNSLFNVFTITFLLLSLSEEDAVHEKPKTNKSGSLINHIFYERLCSKNSFTLMGVPQLLTRQNLSFLNSVYRPASPMFRVNFPILCKQNNMPCLGITGR